MLLALEIFMLASGLYLLISGKFALSKKRVVQGAIVRLAGLVLLLPIPLAIILGLSELVLIGVCLAVALLIGFTATKPRTA